ncbi:MAG: response regulator [Magnetococcales bacterium]|nr:response regulator [Magnetococcales bacterium]
MVLELNKVQKELPPRLLVADDEQSVLKVYTDILAPNNGVKESLELSDLRSQLFGNEDPQQKEVEYEITTCQQAQDVVDKVTESLQKEKPYSVVFLDVRMPPGQDGIWAAEKIRHLDPNVGIVIVTGFSDHGLDEISQRVMPRDKLLYLKKPFSPEEILQITASFSEKWSIEQALKNRTAELESSLEILQKTQDHMIQTERLTALGELVAGISHEINTPLGISFTAISHLQNQARQLTELLKIGKLSRSAMERLLNDIVSSSDLVYGNLERATQLIQSFKAVSVDQTSQQKRKFNLRTYLDEIFSSLRPKFKNTQHEVNIECPENLIIDSYPGIISQIITNFVVNSLTHGFAKGTSGAISIKVISSPDWIKMVYQDDGLGLDQETKKRIFEPFFTTARDQDGSGLGMHIVYNLITQELGGSVQCESEPGEGVSFTIKIPL